MLRENVGETDCGYIFLSISMMTMIDRDIWYRNRARHPSCAKFGFVRGYGMLPTVPNVNINVGTFHYSSHSWAGGMFFWNVFQCCT